jgi:hypothetical protein
MPKSRKRRAAQKRNPTRQAVRRQRSSPPPAGSATRRLPGHTPEAELAEQLGLKVRTLRKWRAEGVGPPYVKIARFFHYNDESYAAWLKKCETTPVRSASRTTMAA